MANVLKNLFGNERICRCMYFFSLFIAQKHCAAGVCHCQRRSIGTTVDGVNLNMKNMNPTLNTLHMNDN